MKLSVRESSEEDPRYIRPIFKIFYKSTERAQSRPPLSIFQTIQEETQGPTYNFAFGPGSVEKHCGSRLIPRWLHAGATLRLMRSPQKCSKQFLVVCMIARGGVQCSDSISYEENTIGRACSELVPTLVPPLYHVCFTSVQGSKACRWVQ